MARPKKNFDEIKLLQINLRVTLSEQVQLEEAAKTHGLSLVQYIRVRALKKQLPKFKMTVADQELVIELSRIGNNINQITKKINQGNPNIDDLEDLLLLLMYKLNYMKMELLK
jgi:uncharacterized protein (DUF1778 family)